MHMCFWANAIYFWKHIAKTKSYESEIGKLNAQIEKIAQVTDTIKSVENKI